MLELTVPGDKSMAHRALLCALLADGESRVCGLPAGDDVRRTIAAVQALGARVVMQDDACCIQSGPALQAQHPVTIDCGSSGTTLRLLTGLLAGRAGTFHLHTSRQLARRPMDHVVALLRAFGADLTLLSAPEGGERVRIHGRALTGASVHCALPSAQLKCAALFAALQAEGTSQIHEAIPTRDHLERLLPLFAGRVTRVGSAWHVSQQALRGAALHIPGDLSAAAPWIVGTILFRQAPLTIRSLGLNPSRLGFVNALRQMGARIDSMIEAWSGEEPVGSLTVWPSPHLQPIHLPSEAAPTCIDELPLLALAAAVTPGVSRIEGVEGLRSKESDRLQAILELFRESALKAKLEQGVLVVTGCPEVQLPDHLLPCFDDHRMAMLCALLAAAQRSTRALRLDAASVVEKSYPRFWRDFAAVFPNVRVEV